MILRPNHLQRIPTSGGSALRRHMTHVVTGTTKGRPSCIAVLLGSSSRFPSYHNDSDRQAERGRRMKRRTSSPCFSPKISEASISEQRWSECLDMLTQLNKNRKARKILRVLSVHLVLLQGLGAPCNSYGTWTLAKPYMRTSQFPRLIQDSSANDRQLAVHMTPSALQKST